MPWVQAGTLPQLGLSAGVVFGHAIPACIVDRHLYLFGGETASPFGLTPQLWSVPIDEGGVNGKPVLQGVLPAAVQARGDNIYSQVAVWRNRWIYFVNSNGGYIVVYKTESDGTLTFVQTLNYFNAFSGVSTNVPVIVGDCLYIVGSAQNASATTSVVVAALGGDGGLSAFSSLGPLMPYSQVTGAGRLQFFNVVTDGRHIFIIGGLNDGGVGVSTAIYCIDVPSAGQLQNPRVVAYFPPTAMATTIQGACVFKDRKLIVVAGGNNGLSSTVYSAQTWAWDIGGDGSLGPAQQLSDYPVEVRGNTLVADPHGNRIFGFGGWDGSSDHSAVYMLTDPL